MLPITDMEGYPNHHHKERKYSKEHIARIMESHTSHLVVLGLILVDFSIVMAEILISLWTEQQCQKPSHEVELVLEVLHWITVGILSLFVIENTIHLLINPKYFQKMFHIFDVAVIITSLVLSLVFHGVGQEVAGLLVFLRFWRIIRLGEALSASLVIRHTEEITKLRKKISELESRLRGENEAFDAARKQL